MRHTHTPLSRGAGGGGAPAAGEMTPESETRAGGRDRSGRVEGQDERTRRERERPDDNAGRREPEEE